MCDEFHLVRNRLPRHNQAESTTHKRLFFKFSSKIILFFEDFPNSCEADSPSELSKMSLTELIQPHAFGKTAFKLNMVVMIMKVGENVEVKTKDGRFVDCHSVIEMNYTR